MKRLFNISTHACDLEVIGHDWNVARAFCERNGFDGFELSPADGYDFQRIPPDVVTGVHLHFFPLLEPIWRGDPESLQAIFGDDETVRRFYGGPDRQAVIDTYRRELALAQRLGCGYVVFHVSQSEPESVYTGESVYSWRDTVELCAEVVNEVMSDNVFTGEILFENLWFPGSLRLDSAEEVELLLEKVDYPRCGLVLDTGHVLNKNPGIRSEAQGIEYLIRTVQNLGELRRLVRAVHLTRSLSGDYVARFRGGPSPFPGVEKFWDRFWMAQGHVMRIDQHEPFEDPGIARLFDWISPDYLVFEFYYSDMAEWQGKIDRQKQALEGAAHHTVRADGIDPSLCPLCGRPNDCGALRGESTCWCKDAVIPQDVLDRVPPEARGHACVCRACAGLTAASE